MQSGQQVERDQLIERYTPFVEYVTNRLIKGFGLPVKLYDDFIAAGYLGLVEAAERFDSEKGVEFKRYAYLRIRGAIIDDIRRHSDLSSGAYRFTKALKAVQDIAETDLETLDPHEELGPREKLARILEQAAQGALAFRCSLSDVGEEVSGLVNEEDTPQEKMEKDEQRKSIQSALEVLSDKERIIVEEYYIEGYSFVEISRRHEDLSKSWISRLHVRALSKLKDHFVQEHCETF